MWKDTCRGQIRGRIWPGIGWDHIGGEVHGPAWLWCTCGRQDDCSARASARAQSVRSEADAEAILRRAGSAGRFAGPPTYQWLSASSVYVSNGSDGRIPNLISQSDLIIEEIDLNHGSKSQILIFFYLNLTAFKAKSPIKSQIFGENVWWRTDFQVTTGYTHHHKVNI